MRLKPIFFTAIALLLTSTTALSAEPSALSDEQEVFWKQLSALCGKAFRGTLVDGSENARATFADQELIFHVRECAEEILKVPFHVGENHSRTWVLTKTASGLRLKHDHRHEDGTEEEITQYGGDTVWKGRTWRQEFLVDAFTVAMLPAAEFNLWAMEIVPGERFVYELGNTESPRRFRVEFDLTQPLEEVPDAPWGHE